MIDWKPSKRPDLPCRKCGVAGKIEYRIVTSSCGGYEDVKHRCNNCGHVWWVEGADA